MRNFSELFTHLGFFHIILIVAIVELCSWRTEPIVLMYLHDKTLIVSSLVTFLKARDHRMNDVSEILTLGPKIKLNIREIPP